VDIGIRYLLDVAPGGDDGPLLASGQAPAGIGTEATLNPVPLFPTVRANDRGNDLSFVVIGDGPTPVLKYASWPDAFDSAFDYTTSSRDIASEGGLNDSALLYYFGGSTETAITLAPDDFVIVQVRLIAPQTFQELCGNGLDDDGDALIDETDPDCAPPSPPPSPSPTPAAEPTATPLVTPGSLPNTGGKRR
jgi:hypothetical protein